MGFEQMLVGQLVKAMVADRRATHGETLGRADARIASGQMQDTLSSALMAAAGSASPGQIYKGMQSS